MKALKTIIKITGVFILFFALYAFIYTLSVSSSQRVTTENTFIASDNEISIVAQQDDTEYVKTSDLTEDSIDKNGFYIRIDAIDLFKPVVANVDPRYKEIYVKSWETGVSHGKFTSLPDKIGNVYLFAHAVSDISRMLEQNAWFTKIDELVEGDEIIIYYKGKKYTYPVSRIYTVSPTATGVYTGVSPVPKVTLQTCGPPRGSLASRYMVEGLRVSVENF